MLQILSETAVFSIPKCNAQTTGLEYFITHFNLIVAHICTPFKPLPGALCSLFNECWIDLSWRETLGLQQISGSSMQQLEHLCPRYLPNAVQHLQHLV